MKYFILIISLFSFTTKAFSQDSITIKTEIDTFNQSNYEGQYDYVFARKEPQKHMFKMGLFSYYGGGSGELFSYERKVFKDISIHLSINSLRKLIGFGNTRFLSSRQSGDTITIYESQPSFGFSVEPRWYFNMKKDMAKGLVANNFHGSYIGLRASYEIETSPEYNIRYGKDSSAIISPKNEYNKYISSELCFGIQRRILHWQYIDFGIATGIRTRIKTQIPTDQKRTQWIFNYRLTYGVLLNNIFTKTKGNGAKCDALRCFEEEKSMWKFGVMNLIAQLNERQFSGIFSAAYERKIPKTMFSVETSVAIGGNLYAKSVKSVPKYDNKYSFSVAIMPRYYYDLKKEIAKGQSADNLSGAYLGLKAEYGTAQRLDNLQVQSANATFIWGLQQRLLKHLYYDFSIGYYLSAEKARAEIKNSRGVSFNFSLGLAF